MRTPSTWCWIHQRLQRAETHLSEYSKVLHRFFFSHSLSLAHAHTHLCSQSLSGGDSLKFSEIPYRLEVEESERISLDHVTRYARSGQSGNTSTALPHLSSVNNAVSLLRARLGELVQFMQDVRSGISISHSHTHHLFCVQYSYIYFFQCL